MESWKKIEMSNHAIESFVRPRSRNRIGAVAQLVSQFFQEHGRDAFFHYKTKADTAFPGKNDYFVFQRPSMMPIRCRSKHELLSMPYIFSDINLASKPFYKLFMADFYSEKSTKILDEILQKGRNAELEKLLVFEHVKPCTQIREILKQREDITDEASINEFLESHLFVAVLTREEDKAVNMTRVNGIHCRQRMPDPEQYFSRYSAANEQRQAGITLFMPSEAHRERLITAQFPQLSIGG